MDKNVKFLPLHLQSKICWKSLKLKPDNEKNKQII